MTISIPWLVFLVITALGLIIGAMSAFRSKNYGQILAFGVAGATVGAFLSVITSTICLGIKNTRKTRIEQETHQIAINDMTEPWSTLYATLESQSTVVRHALLDRFVQIIGPHASVSTRSSPQLTLKQYRMILQMPCDSGRDVCKSWNKAFARTLAQFIPNFKQEDK